MSFYISTRGQAPKLNFPDTTLTGLARDGGLYVPDAVPKLSAKDLAEIASLPYTEVAARIIAPFIGNDIPAADLNAIIKAAYKVFTHPDIVPLHKFEDDFYLLELFHGPTLAFKDVALQFLGHVFDYILTRKKQRVTIVGATSGDTGSAAIEAFKGKDNVNIFILHPHGRVSEVQRRQMTTVTEKNVFNIAIEGSFDDCQDMVKAMFNDQTFRDEMALSAINSINWARILAQVVYYVYASTRFKKPVTFCVPTGNFGNIYAGHVARTMGAPIGKLIAAANRNDILHRFFESGEMRAEGVTPSLSPSMDIQISSNFERLLFELYGRNGTKVLETMDEFRAKGSFKVSPETLAQVKTQFASGRLDDEQTLDVIRDIYKRYNYILDPHTAVGVGVAEASRKQNPQSTIVTLATAHPAKFPAAVKKAIGIEPALPAFLADLYQRKEKYDVLPVDLAKVQQFVRDRAKH
jgi:threonine synthase